MVWKIFFFWPWGFLTLVFRHRQSRQGICTNPRSEALGEIRGFCCFEVVKLYCFQYTLIERSYWIPYSGLIYSGWPDNSPYFVLPFARHSSNISSNFLLTPLRPTTTFSVQSEYSRIRCNDYQVGVLAVISQIFDTWIWSELL